MFLVIDGSSMLVTAYHALLPNEIRFERDSEKKKLYYDKIMHNSKGVYTNAIYGMLGQILKIVTEQKPEYMAIVFDKSRNTFRRDLYSEYKAQRKSTDEPLKQQFVLMEQIIEQLGIKCLYDDKIEADDLAGSIIKLFEDSQSMRFMTKDHDYLQLVNENTRGWMVQTSWDNVHALEEKYLKEYGVKLENFKLPDKVFEFGPNIVKGEEGVEPIQVIDKKAICGDASDNIPGVKGVGDAAVIPLLSKYKTVEEIYAEIEKCADEKQEKELAKRWKEELGIKRSPIKNLKEQKEIAFLSKQLATIKTDASVPTDIKEYKYEINRDMLKKILEEYEFKSLMEYVEKF